jgi:hypothetical protein
LNLPVLVKKPDIAGILEYCLRKVDIKDLLTMPFLLKKMAQSSQIKKISNSLVIFF